jgi:hypothetical protein
MPRNDKELDEIPSGKIKMGKKFFENLRNRVESIRPEAGNYISVTAQTGYGFKISGDFNVVTSTAITVNAVSFNVVTITVCSNGTPAEIAVLTVNSVTSFVAFSTESTQASPTRILTVQPEASVELAFLTEKPKPTT